MSFNRRGFLNSLFISPAVAQARKEQIEQDQKQQLEDEQVARVIKAQQLGVSPSELKPRCGVCDAVLISGKCQHTVKCRYCTSQAIEQERKVHEASDNSPFYEYMSAHPGVYVHVVEDKCVLCGNSPLIPQAYSGYSGCSYAATITCGSYASDHVGLGVYGTTRRYR